MGISSRKKAFLSSPLLSTPPQLEVLFSWQHLIPACVFLPCFLPCRSCFSFIFQPLICRTSQRLHCFLFYVFISLFQSSSACLRASLPSKFASLFLSACTPNSFTLTHSPLPATHHPSLPHIRNIKQNPFPLERGTNPRELLLISVRASLFDSLQMSLTPCKQDTHRHMYTVSSCGCNLCRQTRPLLASLLYRHRQIAPFRPNDAVFPIV